MNQALRSFVEDNLERITETGCWIWMRGQIPRGYGQTSAWGRNRLVHRIMWELCHGPIPDGLQVLHKCDVRLCANPDHLFLGTNQDNVNDKVAKGRHLRGSATSNAKLTEDQVRKIKDLRASAGWGAVRIGRFLGVTQKCVEGVIYGWRWKHVTD